MSVVVAEGIRDRDKTQLMSTLSSIASVRDNTYHLMRHVWNDVQEDWPFYTEQDRQMLKRYKATMFGVFVRIIVVLMNLQT